jgi:hypothetical protein
MSAQRDYKKEYEQYHSKPEQIKRRGARNEARRKMIAAGVIRKGSNMDIDHIDRNPLNNRPSNLRPQPKSINRARNSHKRKC